jgi:hypothetical protein
MLFSPFTSQVCVAQIFWYHRKWSNKFLGSYILYTHMMNQRRKVMRDAKAQPAK